jgi:hypothetical protein
MVYDFTAKNVGATDVGTDKSTSRAPQVRNVKRYVEYVARATKDSGSRRGRLPKEIHLILFYHIAAKKTEKQLRLHAAWPSARQNVLRHGVAPPLASPY